MNFVFDFGGVVFRWRPAVLLHAHLPHRVTDTASASHWVAQFFQAYGGDWGDFDRGAVDTNTLVERIAHRTGLRIIEVARVVNAVPHELQAQADTVALLQALRDAGHGLYYLSNMPLPYASHLLAANDFLAWFADGIFSSHVQLIKPDPAIFALAQQRFGLPPQDLLFLDDTLANVEAAQALGWNALHFHDAAQARSAIAARGWL